MVALQTKVICLLLTCWCSAGNEKWNAPLYTIHLVVSFRGTKAKTVHFLIPYSSSDALTLKGNSSPKQGKKGTSGPPGIAPIASQQKTNPKAVHSSIRYLSQRSQVKRPSPRLLFLPKGLSKRIHFSSLAQQRRRPPSRAVRNSTRSATHMASCRPLARSSERAPSGHLAGGGSWLRLDTCE